MSVNTEKPVFYSTFRDSAFCSLGKDQGCPRVRFYMENRLGRGKSQGVRISGVVFGGDSAKISLRKQSGPFAFWEGLGESL